MRIKLVLLGDGGQRTVYRLKKLPTVVGRGRDADLTLAHPLASRHHCELYEVEGTLCVRDLGSLNGTFVGDFRVTEAALESGDLLTIGSAKFEVVIEKDSTALLPPGSHQGHLEPDAIQHSPESLEEVQELEEVEDSFSDIDFVEDDDAAPAAVKPTESPQQESKQVLQPSPAKLQHPTKPQSTKPKTTPTVKPKAVDASAASQSRVDLGNIGEEAVDPVGGDDSGLNSFLRKL